MSIHFRWIFPLLAGLGLAALIVVSGAQAGPELHASAIEVTTLVDEINNDGDCSLRD